MKARTLITRDIYDRMLAALADAGGSVLTAAKALGIPRERLNRGWLFGYPSLKLPPLREAYRNLSVDDPAALQAKAEAAASRRLIEDAAAKAALEATSRQAAREAKAQLEARADARDDAVGVLDEERKLRKGGRAVAGQNIIASAKWGRAHQLVAEELIAKVEAGRKDMSAEQLADLARTMALVDRSRAALLRDAIELERLHRGDPSVILGVTPTEMNVDEAVREIEEANADLMRYRRRGLELVKGGGGEAESTTINVTPGQ